MVNERKAFEDQLFELMDRYPIALSDKARFLELITNEEFIEENVEMWTSTTSAWFTEDHHDFIFTFGRKPISGPGGVKGALRGACKNAGVPYGRKAPSGIIMHDFRRTVKTNMQAAGVSKVCRDLILGHSLQGMDTHYIVPSEETLTQAIDKYTRWLDDQIAKTVASVDQNVDQAGI